MEQHASTCYCCKSPANPSAAMDIDAALNELGMLSTSTNSRKEFMREKRAVPVRRKCESEPGLVRNYSDPGVGAGGPPATPANSPSRGAGSPGALGYQIVTMNPQFVTRLFAATPSPNRLSPTDNAVTRGRGRASPVSGGRVSGRLVVSPAPVEEIRLRLVDLGAKYSQDSLERDRHYQRTSRVRRFKKPYEVPWRVTSHIPLLAVAPPQDAPQPNSFRTSPAPPPSEGSSTLSPPDKSSSGQTRSAGNSNSASPEKHEEGSANPLGLPPIRSRSLDEMDFNRLRLAETAANHNHVGSSLATRNPFSMVASTSLSQGLEIDNMAQHLENLQVNEMNE